MSDCIVFCDGNISVNFRLYARERTLQNCSITFAYICTGRFCEGVAKPHSSSTYASFAICSQLMVSRNPLWLDWISEECPRLVIQEHGEDGPDGSTIESGASCVAPRIRCLGGQLSGAATQAQTELTKPTLGANARRARTRGAQPCWSLGTKE